jgi:hypothetical protein
MKFWLPSTGLLPLTMMIMIMRMKQESMAAALIVRRGVLLSPRSSSSLSMMDLLSSSSTTAAGMDVVNDFFQTQPFMAAFMTCSLKASTADVLAQTSSFSEEDRTIEKCTTTKHIHHRHHHSSGINKNCLTPLLVAWNEKQTAVTPITTASSSSSAVNWSRTLAFYLYGGLYQGMFLQFLYTIAYPTLYGNHPHQLLLQVHTDIVFFGPFVTLPLAYVLRAWIDGTSSSQPMTLEYPTVTHDTIRNSKNNHFILAQAWRGLEKYKNHIKSQNLLWKYWAIWGPAQTINFTIVPPHLRVVFVACVSFFWVYLFSMVSSQGIMAATTTEEAVVKRDATTVTSTSSEQQTKLLSWRIRHHRQNMPDNILSVWKNEVSSTNPLSKPIRSV